MICGTCHSTNSRLDFDKTYLTGSLQNASGGKCGLREALATYFAPHDRRQHCAHCNTDTWQKYCEPVVTASETLLILFQYPPELQKNRLQLDPWFALSTFPGSPSDTENVVYAFYRLYGIVFQAGGDNAGHYMAGMETPAGEWMWYNDLTSGRTNLQQLEALQDGNVKIYMLAYRKLFQMPGKRAKDDARTGSDPPIQQEKQPGENPVRPRDVGDD